MPHGRLQRAGPITHAGTADADAMLDRIQLGTLAKELKDNPAFAEMFKAARKGLTREWQESKPEEKDKREQAYSLLQALGRLEQACDGLILDGNRDARRSNLGSLTA